MTKTELLEATNVILAKAEAEAKETGSQFNLFELLNASNKEIELTRYLYYFLRPEGAHGRGNEPIEFLIKNLPTDSLDAKFQALLREPIEGEVQVLREENLGRKRSSEGVNIGGNIDLVIRWGNLALIVENKPYAWDQPAQLERYFQTYIQRGFEPVLVYLTQNGARPSDGALGACEEDRVICLSYAYLIDILLSYYHTLPKGNHYASSLRQFVDFLSKNFHFPKIELLTVQEQISTQFKNVALFKAAKALGDAAEQFIENQYRIFFNNILLELSSAGCNLESPGGIVDKSWRKYQKETLFFFKGWDDLCLSIGFDNHELGYMFFALRSRNKREKWAKERSSKYVRELNKAGIPAGMEAGDYKDEIWFYWKYYNKHYVDFLDPWTDEVIYNNLGDLTFAKIIAEPLIKLYQVFDEPARKLAELYPNKR